MVQWINLLQNNRTVLRTVSVFIVLKLDPYTYLVLVGLMAGRQAGRQAGRPSDKNIIA